jgi:bleomycin hydrolase
VTREYKLYGIVPKEVYSGMEPGRIFFTHEKMFGELQHYMENVKYTNAWDEAQVVATVKSILNHYMGVPPESFEWKGAKYTPKEFLTSYLKLKMDDYVDVLSYLQQPFWKQVEYEVPDNWRCKDL